MPERTPAKDLVSDTLDSPLKRSGMSSLDPKDAVADYSSLTEAQLKTLDQWEAFFAKVGHLMTSSGSADGLEVQYCRSGQRVETRVIRMHPSVCVSGRKAPSILSQ